MPAPFLRSINLEWISQSPNTGLGISPHSVGESGIVCQLWQEIGRPRDYVVETLAASPQTTSAPASAARAARITEFQSDVISRSACYPGGQYLYATSGSELYFLWTGADGRPQSLALPIRQGDRFLGLQASGEGDTRRTAAILTQDAAGQHTITLVESPEPNSSSTGGALRVSWSRIWPDQVSAYALSSDAGYLAVATSGSVSLIDRAHAVAWTAATGGLATTEAVAVADTGAVAVIDTRGAIQCFAAGGGSTLWQLNTPVGESVLPDTMPAGLICCDAGMKTVLCALNRVDAFGELEAAYLLLDGASGDLLWEDALASPINGVGIAASGAYAAISCQSGATTLLSFADRVNPSASIERALQWRAHELVTQAKQAYLSENAELAVRLLNEALDQNPGLCVGIGFYDDAVWTVRQNALAETKTISAQSLARIDAALALLPRDERLTIRRNALTRLLAEAIAREAALYLSEGRLEESIDKYVEALTIDRSLQDVRASLLVATDRLTLSLLKQADLAFHEERFTEAIGLLERVAGMRPGEAAIVRRLELARGLQAYAAAMELYVRKQFEESVFWFRKTLTILPDHTEAARYLAYAENNVRAHGSQVAPPEPPSPSQTSQPTASKTGSGSRHPSVAA